VLTHDTIYTLKLRRRGIDIDAPQPASVMARVTVAEAMGTLPKPLFPEEPLAAVIARFAAERADTLPVIDSTGKLLGVIAATDVEQALGEQASTENGHLYAAALV
jgi:chloride channel protein, CIC family